MAKKTAKSVVTGTTQAVRPALVPGQNTKCGRCTYFNTHHPKLKTDCQDGYGINAESPACIDFDFRLDYNHYRANKRVKAFNAAAARHQECSILSEEVKGLTGQVFQKAEMRAGVAKKLAPVRHVLRKEDDTSALIPFFEEVQRFRDRVSEILSLTIMQQGDVDITIQEAESYINLTFPEVRAMKPEAIRTGMLRTVLRELYIARTCLSGLHAQCDNAIKNFAAEHTALVEIQIASRSPVGIPRSRIADGADDTLPRGSKRWGQ